MYTHTRAQSAKYEDIKRNESLLQRLTDAWKTLRRKRTGENTGRDVIERARMENRIISYWERYL